MTKRASASKTMSTSQIELPTIASVSKQTLLKAKYEPWRVKHKSRAVIRPALLFG
jgi:hypothetical protein